MKTINTRAMIEGSILASMTAIIGIFYRVPIVEAITMFWSVPIIIVGYRNGFRVSLLAAFVAAMLVSIIVNPIVGLILFIAYAIPGAIMGYMIRKQYSPIITLIVCGLILSVTIVLEFILGLQLILGTDIIEILGNLKATMVSYNSILNKQMAESAAMLSKFGFDETTMPRVFSDFNILLKQLVLCIKK